MKKKKKMIVPTGAEIKSMEKNTVSLSALVQKICDSWAAVDKENKKDIEVASITTSLTISRTTSFKGEIKVLVFKLGGFLQRSKWSKITLQLATEDKEPTAERRRGNGEKELTGFFNSTLRDFKKLKDNELLSTLKERTLTIDAGLTISKALGGGLDFSIQIFTVAAEFGLNVEQGHTLQLVLISK